MFLHLSKAFGAVHVLVAYFICPYRYLLISAKNVYLIYVCILKVTSKTPSRTYFF